MVPRGSGVGARVVAVTDNDFLETMLGDGRWHGHIEIIAESIRQRGHGLTVHSRAADLRKRGHTVETRLERNDHGRTLSFYRLVALDEPEAFIGVGSGSSSVPTTDGPDDSTSPPPSLVEPAGTLLLFDPPQRGAYGNEAA